MTYINKNFLDQVFNADNMFNEIEKIANDINRRVYANAKQTFADGTPANFIIEDDDSVTIEIAIPGKTKEDVKVTSKTEDAVTYLIVEAGQNPTNMSDEEKESKKNLESKRYYCEHRMKAGYIRYIRPIANTLDISKLDAVVENGLLTIKIPVAEAAKPIEFNVR